MSPARQALVLEQVRLLAPVRAKTVAAELQLHPETVKRYLARLKAQGLVRRDGGIWWSAYSTSLRAGSLPGGADFDCPPKATGCPECDIPWSEHADMGHYRQVVE